jgi:hypothetical protein
MTKAARGPIIIVEGRVCVLLSAQLGRVCDAPKGYVTEVKRRVEGVLVVVLAEAAESDCLLGDRDERAVGAARRIVSTEKKQVSMTGYPNTT